MSSRGSAGTRHCAFAEAPMSCRLHAPGHRRQAVLLESAEEGAGIGGGAIIIGDADVATAAVAARRTERAGAAAG